MLDEQEALFERPTPNRFLMYTSSWPVVGQMYSSSSSRGEVKQFIYGAVSRSFRRSKLHKLMEQEG